MSNDSNQHIADYIRSYVQGSSPPKYGVLLNGEWGSGKTHLVQELLAELRRPPFEIHAVYVSLYGLETEAQIDHQLLTALHPLYGAYRALVSAIFKRTQVDLNPAKFAQRYVASLYVFDDLERCRAPIDVTMGYINRFVEHADRKVVVIANESEISDSSYQRAKEKIIGKTFNIQTSVAAVFDYFVAGIQEPARERISSVRAEILDTQRLSGSRNLRVLRQTLWDFERLLSVIPGRYFQKREALVTLASTFFALSQEIKATRLHGSDILERNESSARMAVAAVVKTAAHPISPAAERWKEFRKRYPLIEMRDGLLTDSLWHEVLIEGVLKPPELLNALDNGRYFEKRDWPSWKAMWDLYNFTDEELNFHLPRFEADFRARAFIHAGEVLHVFGARAMMHFFGLDQRDPAVVVSDCKKYVDDIVGRPEFDPLGAAAFTTGRLSYQNRGYGYDQFPILREVMNYFEQRRREEVEHRTPGWAQELLVRLQANSLAVAQQISSTSYGGLGDVPLFHHLDATAAAVVIAELSSPDQLQFFEGLRERYRRVSRETLLRDERPWLELLRRELTDRASTLTAMNRYRLVQRIEEYFNEFLHVASA